MSLAVRAVSAQQLRALDRAATHEYGIPALLLMEHAALAVAQVMQQRVASSRARLVCIAGRGHNGGDGLAAIRLLQARGFQPEVFLLGSRSALKDEPAVYARILTHVGITLHELRKEAAWARCTSALAQADWIIDALIGTGFNGALTPDAIRAIRLMNAARRPILAVDTPSGLDVDTGRIAPVAVAATITVTFGLPKQGFFVGQGPEHVGELVVDDIGFPPALLAAYLRA